MVYSAAGFCMISSCARPLYGIVKPIGLLQQHALSLKEVLLDHAKHGKAALVLEAYQQMNQQITLEPNGYVFVSVIKACASQGASILGKMVHAQIVECSFESQVFVGSSLINMHIKCGGLEDAQRVFDGLPMHDIVIWNVMIAGYAQFGHVEKMMELFQQLQKGDLVPNTVTWNVVIGGCVQSDLSEKAFHLFNQMQQDGCMPNDVTFACVLNACTSMEAQDHGKLIHLRVIESGLSSDVFLGNTLINFYVKCGELEHAYELFKRLPQQDCVTWNILITGYALNDHSEEALRLFHDMQKKGQIPDLVTWNALLTGHVQHRRGEQALLLFQQMEQQGKKPDRISFANVFKACSIMAALDKGKLIHAYMIETNFSLDLLVFNAVIDMYAKCGSLDDAYRVFRWLPKRDSVTWNSIIAAHGVHNQYSTMLKCFEHMQQEGFQPDEVTFLCILSACTRGGFLDSGHSHFTSMLKYHSISPKPEHYNCMVDLLGRKGFLKEAESLLEMEAMKGNVQGWTSLLSHCRTYGDVDLGRQCFDHAIFIDDQYTSSYELMSGLYADMGMWENVAHVQELRRRVSAQKKPGVASIEIKNQVHIFIIGDKSHPQSSSIYAKVKRLNWQVKQQEHASFEVSGLTACECG